MSFLDKLKSFFGATPQTKEEVTAWPFPVGPETTVVVDPVPTKELPKVVEGKTKGGTGAVKKPKANPKPKAPKAPVAEKPVKPAVKAKSVKAKTKPAK